MLNTRQFGKRDQELFYAVKHDVPGCRDMLYLEFYEYLMEFITNNYLKKIKSVVRYSEERSEEVALDLCLFSLTILEKNIQAGKYEPRKEAKMSTYLVEIFKNLVRDFFRHKRIFIAEIEEGNIDSLPYEIEISRYDENQEAILLRAMKILEKERPICYKLLVLYANKKKMAEIATLLKFNGEDSAKTQKYKCVQSLKSIYSKINVEN